MDVNQENPWTKLTGRQVYDNPWICVEEHKVLNPRGGKGIYGKVRFKNKAIGIIPIDEAGNTWLVGQYRYTLDQYSWEIPMGGGPIDQSVLASAKRELKEETGLLAASWQEIMIIHTSNSVTDEEGIVFIATELEQQDTEFDETEDLKIRKLPFREACEMVMKGQITDSISVAGILKAKIILEL